MTDKECIFSLNFVSYTDFSQYYIGESVDKHGRTGCFVPFFTDDCLMFAVRIQRPIKPMVLRTIL